MKTYQTNNFNDFELIKSNRPIHWGKVNKMRKEIKRKNLTSVYNVNVNSKAASKRRYGMDGTKMAVVDGQHRFLSCKLEGITMFYKITDDLQLGDIPKAAALQDSWKMKDYIHHYAQEGKMEYMLFRSYSERNNFAPSFTMTILCGDRGSHMLDKLKNGELKITRNWNFSEGFATAVHDLGQYFPFNKQARFLEAYLICYSNKKFSHSKMMGKLEYLSNKMKRCSDVYSHLEQLEYIYNFNSTSRIKLNTARRRP